MLPSWNTISSPSKDSKAKSASEPVHEEPLSIGQQIFRDELKRLKTQALEQRKAAKEFQRKAKACADISTSGTKVVSTASANVSADRRNDPTADPTDASIDQEDSIFLDDFSIAYLDDILIFSKI